ncbi:pyrroloquinoline quinone biosynthesis protein PqqB [Aliterella atlantica]|uniref:Coenzyme PQQ synthesis protein B n=1 Tax=Aliterella atlantica CENA595 TaxID=1618023 RepID=A0A0D8ZMZ7_9CYAN|nr:pyrroloquinoline quinone biosynthesis protein PqqB [Aliterella atlantica]KJH70145.1 pyrroloquinoline quinone biosynthesis protein PqqB [Aliterella atlantica CENA595]
MLLKILGAAAGGGLPQWNCGCINCQAVRQNRAGISWLNQSSIAVQAPEGDWFLVNASPDIRQQLELLRDAQPLSIRANPIAGVILTDAEIDHTTGLIILRESAQPLHIYGTEIVKKALTDGFPLLKTLESYCGVAWSNLNVGATVPLTANLDIEVFALAAKAPKYMRSQNIAGDWVIGLTICDRTTGKVVTYAPGLAKLSDRLLARFEASDCILVDGTFWQNDDLLKLGISTRTARDMGHLPLASEDGSLHHLSQLKHPRKILVHINNTNPIHLANSQERKIVEEAGIEVGCDGLTIQL